MARSTDPRDAIGNYEHLRSLDGLAEVLDIARRYDDDRGRRVCDIFGTVTGDINITYAYPGVIAAWHAHRHQYDEWFVIKGALKIGLARPKSGGGYEGRFFSLSEHDVKVLRIPPGVLHGWRNHTNEIAILMYHISRKYDVRDPDEQRYSLAEVGLDWSTASR